MIDWSHWHNEPFLVGGLIFLGWLYGVLTGPLRQRVAGADIPYPRAHAVRFYLALVCFYLAVGSPLDQIGERFLFSAHMLQHQLIVYPAALLFLAGLPGWLVRPVLGRPRARPVLRVLLHPIVCGAVYVVVISSWHAPLLYDWALQDKTVHIAEHFTFFGAALFFWWPLCSPSSDHPPVSYPAQMFYLLGVTIGMTPVFAYITFSQDVLYPTYEFAPRLLDLSPHQDQVLAGTMMKLVGFAVSLGAFAVAFYRWHQASESPAR
ncbi:MAG TPA: cytochrome c oxidase assembly protein [Opitutaceae bacterium]|nr:cytochrome c oxidase assembly protein [Opitutaceae bacterium]